MQFILTCKRDHNSIKQISNTQHYAIEHAQVLAFILYMLGYQWVCE